ncbi:MAG TPA: hypothetical protein VJ719_09575, partial [Chthoniobacterales bacterium]|nr:hypothetical protein [Chthoniobacterales bacterium]
MRSSLIGATVSATLVLLFSLLLLWRDPLVFWNDDYQISILPVFEDVARSWRAGEWPLLSPYSWVCGNLAGEFQYGTFSLFINAAVVLIWAIFHKFAHQAAALSIAHLLVLATGGYMLARQRNLSNPLATMVALIAALNGWIICWGASDWFGALAAFAWLPWAWWACEKALHCSALSAQRSTLNAQLDSELSVGRTSVLLGPLGVGRLLPVLWPAPFVYLLITGGFPYTILMLGLLVAWLTIKSLVQTKSPISVLPMLLGVALGFGLASPAILALLANVQGSAREAQPAAAHWQWIVPPSALPGIFLPNWTVKWADFSTRYRFHTGTELAGGLVAPVALLYALIRNAREMLRRLGWELTLLAVVLIIAMLPSAGVFRWSFRWLPFFHLVMAVCAAECLRMPAAAERGSRSRFSPAVLAVVILIATAIAMKFFNTGGEYALPLTIALIAITVGWAIADYLLPRSAWLYWWLPPAVTVTVLAATYFCLPTNCGVPRYSFTEALLNPAPLDPARLYLSVYPGPEVAYRTETRPGPSGQIVRPGSTSMWAKLHFINGYSPIRPAGVATQFGAYIHGDFDPDKARSLLTADAGRDGVLARLGVDGITISTEMEFDPEPADEWKLISSNDEGRIFHRRGSPLGRVRSIIRPETQLVEAKILGVRDGRNRIEIDIAVPEGDRPALIAFSRPYFGGYRASLGGRALEVKSERGLFPVIEVPAASRGRLILSYRPNWLVYGSALAGICA